MTYKVRDYPDLFQLGHIERIESGRYYADLFRQFFPELFGKGDIADRDGVLEQGCYLGIGEACDAAADAGDEEVHLRMLLCEGYEFVDIGLDGFDSALHGGDGITLPLQTNPLPPYRPEPLHRCSCRTASMPSAQIAAEDEYLAFSQLCNMIRSNPACPISVIHF